MIFSFHAICFLFPFPLKAMFFLFYTYISCNGVGLLLYLNNAIPSSLSFFFLCANTILSTDRDSSTDSSQQGQSTSITLMVEVPNHCLYFSCLCLYFHQFFQFPLADSSSITKCHYHRRINRWDLIPFS